MLRSLALIAALTLASCAKTQNNAVVSNTPASKQESTISDNEKAALAVGGAVGVYMVYVVLGFSAFLASVTG